jgi:type VI secretion system secreted protein VgrG
VEGISSFGSESSPGLLSTWTQEWSFRSGQFAQRDYHFKTATTDLLVKTKGKAEFEGASDLEVYDSPGEYEKKSDGDSDTKRRIEAEEVAAHTVRGSSGCRSFSPGYTFKDADGKKYLLTVVSHSASIRGAYESGAADGEFVYVNTFSAIPADVPFRPERSTPKPIVGGSQTAVVVGKSGEEIDTDEHGRIKVQFHWDRLGKKDQKSSCWVRVAQSMAGPGWGGQFIPRIGQEVVVSYLEGDPDQPLVTGVVYNSQNKPPFVLPDNKTQSGFRSRSTKGAGSANCNEIRFEDKKGAEEFRLHAEKDFKREVENDDHLEVGFSKKDPGSRTVKVFNDHTETIGCAEAKSGSRTTTVWKDDATTLKTGNQSINLKLGNRSAKLDVGKDSVEALQGITLKSGPSSIEITPTGIVIKGLQVQVEGQVQTSVKGLMTEINGTAILKAGGAITMIG